MTDPDGKVWIRGARIEYDTSDVAVDENAAPRFPSAEAEDDSQDFLKDMTLEEATEALRPVSDFGGYEYRMAEADAAEIARRVLEEVQNPSMDGAPGVVPEGARVAQPPAGREEKMVIGDDDRLNLNAGADAYPWNNIAYMNGTCTAFKMLNHYTAITAAHCLHTGSGWKTRQPLQFAAGAQHVPGGSPLPATNTTCYGRTVPNCWDGSNAACDYGIIRLRAAGSYDCGAETYNVGYMGWTRVDTCTSNIAVSLAGYPGDDETRAGFPIPTLHYHYRSDGWTKCAGIDPNQMFFYNDGEGGQSWGPLTSYYGDGDYRVRGIYKGSIWSVYGWRNHGEEDGEQSGDLVRVPRRVLDPELH